MLIRVGILTAPQISFEQKENHFVLHDVRIGIGFHWDRYEEQEFSGQLEILHNADGTQTAVNCIDLEEYLVSVISSEMSADSPIELLKAHAVISRSWVIRAVERNKQMQHLSIRQRAYEDAGHVGFDICADDHCQRYEGLKRVNPRARQAVMETKGMVLTYHGQICDTRFSKCCGGTTEEFETCWEDIHYPYLESIECPYCNTCDTQLLNTILNNYDQETHDFYEWTVSYTQDQLRKILLENTHVDTGRILRINPLQRGKSGRIYLLEIIGEKEKITLGKELKIRRSLSQTCLYSSNMEISVTDDHIIFHGKGWGHGVGLCQIGAAVMASQGYSYEDILLFYYRNTALMDIKNM